MSARARPSDDLARARRHLERRGYLHGGLPPAPPAAWRQITFVLALWAALSATLVGGALARTGASWAQVKVVALAVAPPLLVLFLTALLAGRAVALRLLAWGVTPQRVAAVLGGAAALLTLGGSAGILWDGLGSAEAALRVGVAAVGCAMIAGVAARRALGREFGGEQENLRAPPWRVEVLLLLAITGVGAASAVLPPAPPPGPAAAVPLATPAAAGRVAVVGVEGLSRGGLEALPAVFPADDWKEIAQWGWVEIRGAAAALPAVAWTSVACGAPPAKHGVQVMEEVRLFGGSDGIVLPATLQRLVVMIWSPLSAARVAARPSLDRRLPTFWEMASRAGCPVLVGGWWGSWPVRQVLGEVVSERAWLGGATGPDAVSPALAGAVAAAWQQGRQAPAATDLLAEELVRRAAARQGASLLALWLPAIDLATRLGGGPETLTVAAGLKPHLKLLRVLLQQLADSGYTIWLLGMPPGGGEPFAASRSVLLRGGEGSASTAELVAVWLAQLGLPPAAGGALPRPELGGTQVVAAAVEYGAPPPPVIRPSAASATVQREVLRSLGYLR
jgi:hypothetical protein